MAWLPLFWLTSKKIFFWGLTVFGLAAIPILFHLATVFITRHQALFQDALVQDVYLYTFIVAMAGFTDTLNDERDWADKRNTTVTSVIVALVASTGYFAALIPYITTSPFGPFLRAIVWPLLVPFLASYCIYKIPLLRSAAKVDIGKR